MAVDGEFDHLLTRAVCEKVLIAWYLPRENELLMRQVRRAAEPDTSQRRLGRPAADYQ